MTPLLFNKGLVDPGYWGNKLFGRIMMEELQIGQGIAHKISRAKVIYGLDPIFDSGTTCIVKVRNQIVYGTKEDNCLAEINLEITKKVSDCIDFTECITKSKQQLCDNYGKYYSYSLKLIITFTLFINECRYNPFFTPYFMNHFMLHTLSVLLIQ